jgi:hypothetical protein
MKYGDEGKGSPSGIFHCAILVLSILATDLSRFSGVNIRSVGFRQADFERSIALACLLGRTRRFIRCWEIIYPVSSAVL